jgi:hypothetical protein
MELRQTRPIAPPTWWAVIGVVAALVLTLLPGARLPADAAARKDRWAPAATATLTPGVQMFTGRSQCTANFVFTDARGGVYLGYAAHCAGTGAATRTDGCRAPSRPLGTRVRFARRATAVSAGTTVGAGSLAYSSWRTMQRRGERRAGACAANDFALVRVDPVRVGRVNPSVPFWGGPVGLGSGPAAGTRTHSWGQSSLRPTTVLSPRTGASAGSAHGGWSTDVYTATPGIPGDSGSGYLDARGRASGVLSTVAIAPLPLSNGVTDLRRALAYARRHAGIPGLRLVPGTVPFDPILR